MVEMKIDSAVQNQSVVIAPNSNVRTYLPYTVGVLSEVDVKAKYAYQQKTRKRRNWDMDAPIQYFPPQTTTMAIATSYDNKTDDSTFVSLQIEPRSAPRSASHVVAFPVSSTALCVLRPNESASNVVTYTIKEGVGALTTIHFNHINKQRALLETSLQSLVKEPHGCFEQTSSTMYPMILSLLYTHSASFKTSFLSSGLRRLLGYEVEGGGFSWFGSKPANEPLTAYGLLEFQDLLRLQESRSLLEEAEVALLKEAVQRTMKWLLVKVGRGM